MATRLNHGPAPGRCDDKLLEEAPIVPVASGGWNVTPGQDFSLQRSHLAITHGMFSSPRLDQLSPLLWAFRPPHETLDSILVPAERVF